MARRILNAIQLDKIAAVDRPCQEHATVAILKRAPEEKEEDSDLSKAVEDALMDKRIEELEKRVLLAGTGVALLSTLLINKFDESKVHRAANGEFAGSGDGKSSSGEKSDHKAQKASKPKRRILRVMRFLANANKWSAAATTTALTGLGVAGIVATGAVTPAAPFFLGAAVSVLGYKAWNYTVKSLTRRIEKTSNPRRSAAVNAMLNKMPQDEFSGFVERFVSQLSDEQADKLAAKVESIASKAGMKKVWSDEAREAAAEARRRGAKHRAEARTHEKEGRTITALKHDMVADHYLEAAEHFHAGRKQRAHDVRRQGEAILGIRKASEIMKMAEGHKKVGEWLQRRADPLSQKIKGRGGPLPVPVDFGRRRAKQGPRKQANRLLVSAGAPGSMFGVNKAKITEAVIKSSFVLAVLPDADDHVRKVLGDTAADYIKDFVNSDNPRFEGKSKQERIKMALGAFYSRKK